MLRGHPSVYIEDLDGRVIDVRDEPDERGLSDSRLPHYDYGEACLEAEVNKPYLVVVLLGDRDLREP